MSERFELIEGEGPVLVTVPHASTYVPEPIARRLNANGRLLRDADWHVDELVRPLAGKASLIVAGFHRYVIDANRDPTGASLYPGQATTELVPTTDFDGEPIWQPGEEPTEQGIEERRAAFHTPYHEAIEGELLRLKHRHGIAVLFDVHSIRSEVPRLFEGRLARFNVGTDNGRTCAPRFETAATDVFSAAGETVLNGRFRGGWTVRFHGRPAENIHAVQIEMAQRHYMNEASPFTLDPDGAAETTEVLARAAEALAAEAAAT
jgi:formiminoglutamase